MYKRSRWNSLTAFYLYLLCIHMECRSVRFYYQEGQDLLKYGSRNSLDIQDSAEPSTRYERIRYGQIKKRYKKDTVSYWSSVSQVVIEYGNPCGAGEEKRVINAKAMWSRKQSVCSAVSGASRGDDQDAQLPAGLQIYPFATALRVRVLQIVCGIGGLVVGAVGWLEERQKPALGLGVPAGAVTVIAAATSVYYSRGFGGWAAARTRSTRSWGTPWRALGPSPCAAIPLTILWTIAIASHIAMLAFCIRSLMNLGCGSTTCIGVAAAQLSVSITTLAAALFMVQLDLRYDASLSPPRPSDANICTAVSMVPLTSVAINSGNSGDGGPEGSPLSKEKNPPPDPPT